MADRDDDDDKVGYGRPPRKHQFKPGESGNPKGRPKGRRRPRSVCDMLMAPVKVNGKNRPFSEAYFQLNMKRALEGDRQANRFIATQLKESRLLDAPRENELRLLLEGARETLAQKLNDLRRRQAEAQEREERVRQNNEPEQASESAEGDPKAEE